MEHRFFVIFSALTLLIYISFAYLQLTLHQSTDVHTEIPWSSFDRNVLTIKLLIKVVLVCSFIFDKGAVDKGIVLMVVFFVMLYVLYRRFVDAIIFDGRVHVISMSLDVVNSYHMFFVASHTLLDSPQFVYTVVIFLLNSLIFVLLLVGCYEYRVTAQLEDAGFLDKASEIMSEVYFLRVL